MIRMMLNLLTGLAIAGYAAVPSFAQTVQESWLRQAGITCGGGQSIDLEGRVDAAILKKLRILGGGADASYNAAELETLLKQFRDTEKSAVYKNYVTCLLTAMQMATQASDLPARDVVLTSPISVDPLDVVKRGQRVAMAPGETIAVGTMAIIFTVDSVEVESQGRKFIRYTWSNSETGKSSNAYVYQAAPVSISEKCVIVPYKIDPDKKQVSLLVNC